MNFKRLFSLILFSCTLTTLHLYSAAEKPIIVFAKGPLSHIDSRIKFTITPKSVEVIYMATEAILPLPSDAKIFTVGPSTPDSKDFIISTDPNAAIHMYTTQIKICAQAVEVFSYDCNGDLHSKKTHWCGCITTWFAPHRGIADPEELHKCAACREKEELEAIDRLIEKQNEDMEDWLLR